MSHAARLRKSPGTFRSLTGISPEKFDALLAELEPRYEAAEARRKDRPGRKRKPGAGPKRTLSLGDRLLMLLMYYRTYVTHALLGFLFGVDQSSVCRNINPLHPLLAGVFRIPERRVRLEEGEIEELFFDATERQINRPGRGQRAYYSGKKKRHTVKHQVVSVRRRKKPGPCPGARPADPTAAAKPRKAHRPRKVRVAAVSPMFPGKTHDKKVYDRTRVVAPPGVARCGDTAYIGTPLRVPHRRPPRGS